MTDTSHPELLFMDDILGDGFPLIDHQYLLVVLKKQGFHHKVATFFGSYLVGLSISYL